MTRVAVECSHRVQARAEPLSSEMQAGDGSYSLVIVPADVEFELTLSIACTSLLQHSLLSDL